MAMKKKRASGGSAAVRRSERLAGEPDFGPPVETELQRECMARRAAGEKSAIEQIEDADLRAKVIERMGAW